MRLGQSLGSEREIECLQLADVADRILRCYQWSAKVERPGNFAHKIVAVLHDQLIVRPSLAQSSDLVDDQKIVGLAERNPEADVGSSYAIRSRNTNYPGNR